MSDKKVEPFEKHTERYERWFSENRGTYLSELDAVRALLPEGDGVEIGVGTGRFAAPVGIGFGIDPSGEMIAIARKRGIEVVRGIAEALPLRRSSLSTALMVTTICFVDSPRRAMEEAYRILRPGGSLIIGFIDRSSPLGRQYMDHRNESAFYRAASFYSVDEMRGYLMEAGFRRFAFVQTICRPSPSITTKEPVKKGHGKGSFVVVRARKPDRRGLHRQRS
jgi:SAM-dependent methyltransferase